MNEKEEAMERLLASYRDGDPTRTEYGFMLVLTVPNRMSREDVEHDLLRSIEFGHPSLVFIYNVPASRPEEVVRDTGSRL